MSAGSFGGAIAAGAISDYLGRRRALMLAACIWVIGAAIQCSAQNVAHLIVGRVVSGLAGILFCPLHKIVDIPKAGENANSALM